MNFTKIWAPEDRRPWGRGKISLSRQPGDPVKEIYAAALGVPAGGLFGKPSSRRGGDKGGIAAGRKNAKPRSFIQERGFAVQRPVQATQSA